MRLWSLHPRYLDATGLVALWREALLAQAVLRGETLGYRSHPQLDRFKAQTQPLAAIGFYLREVQAEARLRGYRFNESKIDSRHEHSIVPVTSGQLAYEWRHLMEKLKARNPAWREKWRSVSLPDCHGLFQVQAGPVESWERGA